MNDLSKAVRAVAKGSGWSAKQNMLSKRIGEYVLAVHPRPGSTECIEFRAKPAAWDHMLWSVLQINGNESQPVSFHFTGAFVCDTPALIQQELEPTASNEKTAQELVQLCKSIPHMESMWHGYDLIHAIADERPQAAYRYHATRVIERMCCEDWQMARQICDAALGGALDLRGFFSSTDKMTPPDVNGCRPSLSFFELAQLWMHRHVRKAFFPLWT